MLIFSFVISLRAVLTSLFLFTTALFGRNQRFLFDAANRQLMYRFTAAFNPAGQENYSGFSLGGTITIG